MEVAQLRGVRFGPRSSLLHKDLKYMEKFPIGSIGLYPVPADLPKAYTALTDVVKYLGYHDIGYYLYSLEKLGKGALERRNDAL